MGEERETMTKKIKERVKWIKKLNSVECDMKNKKWYARWVVKWCFSIHLGTKLSNFLLKVYTCTLRKVKKEWKKNGKKWDFKMMLLKVKS